MILKFEGSSHTDNPTVVEKIAFDKVQNLEWNNIYCAMHRRRLRLEVDFLKPKSFNFFEVQLTFP